MKTLKFLPFLAALFCFGLLNSAHAMDSMHMDNSQMMMHKQINKLPFTKQTFTKLQNSGEKFLVAFHKKGCPRCAKQEQSLQQIYKEHDFMSLKTLVVDYNHDTDALKMLNVGDHSTLILYIGNKELARKAALTNVNDIKKLLSMNTGM